MRRINNNEKSTKIEHWSPRNKDNEKDYTNLLAVCNGNMGKPPAEQHCDTLKGNQTITISPLKPTCEKLVKFGPVGYVYSDDPNIEVELESRLGLNRQHLVDERAKLLDRLKDAMQKAAKNNPDSKLKKADLTGMLKEWQDQKGGEFEPFCQVAIAYIHKKLSRLP